MMPISQVSSDAPVAAMPRPNMNGLHSTQIFRTSLPLDLVMHNSVKRSPSCLIRAVPSECDLRDATSGKEEVGWELMWCWSSRGE